MLLKSKSPAQASLDCTSRWYHHVPGAHSEAEAAWSSEATHVWKQMERCSMTRANKKQVAAPPQPADNYKLLKCHQVDSWSLIGACSSVGPMQIL